MSEAVLIEDLFDPTFPPGVGEALDAMDAEAEAIDWRADAVLAQAGAATGLDDFGDDFVLEPLELLVSIGADHPGLRGSGRVRHWASLVHNATQRLLIVDYLQRHPEIHDLEIERPIIIAGQARTGTTHLHNLIAADPTLRSLQYWESVEPVPPMAEQGQAFDVDPRYRRTEEALAGLNYALPYFRRMHDMYPSHVHEEVQLVQPAFGGMLWETSLADPRYRDWYHRTDQRPWYEWMRTVLKVCTHVGARVAERAGETVPTRWVLKSPQHVEQFATLAATFPDATFLCTHRDPVAITASMTTMVTYSSRSGHTPDGLRSVAAYWSDRIETMFREGAAGRDDLPSSQTMDVRFHDFMADDIAMVERIYELADQPFTDDTRHAMAAFMADHPRGVHGRLRYDLAGLGIDRAERRSALQFYVDRFDLVVEGD